MNKYCYFYSYHFEINAIESYKKKFRKSLPNVSYKVFARHVQRSILRIFLIATQNNSDNFSDV